jgi:hypothetical protein
MSSFDIASALVRKMGAVCHATDVDHPHRMAGGIAESDHDFVSIDPGLRDAEPISSTIITVTNLRDL